MDTADMSVRPSDIPVSAVAEYDECSEPVAEKPAAKKPAAKKPVAEKPVDENPAAEKPVVEKPVAKKPAAKKPAAKKPASGATDATDPMAIDDTLAPRSANAGAKKAAGKCVAALTAEEHAEKKAAMLRGRASRLAIVQSRREIAGAATLVTKDIVIPKVTAGRLVGKAFVCARLGPGAATQVNAVTQTIMETLVKNALVRMVARGGKKLSTVDLDLGA
jgi:hypothetical protein